jgi:hemoglobin
MPDERPLYQRLGGYDAIAAIIDDFFSRMREDPKFARFSVRTLDSRNRSRQLLVDQICSLAGGPCLYIGRDMRTSHAGLGITEDEWQANLLHASAALQKHGVKEPEQSEFHELFNRYKEEIVEAPGATATNAGAR